MSTTTQTRWTNWVGNQSCTPARIERAATEEEVARVQAINERLNEELADLQGRYSNQLSTQDLLSMLLITYANRLEEEQERNNLQPIQERIASLENLLEQVFDQ